MKILGISAFYHDAAAAILVDGKILAAAQEERFSRKKHDPGFPSQAVQYCLDHAGTTIDDLDAVVFYDKPLLKFERLLETYYGFSPRGWRSFITAMPVWMSEKLFLKRLIRRELKQVMPYRKRYLKLLFPEHHLSHAASAFYPSPFAEAAILTIDGVGEWSTASICHGQGKDISVLREMHFPHSLGLLYSAFTYFLGFRVNSGEYKLMGLAPYGNPESERVGRFVDLIKTELISLKKDGSVWLNPRQFSYASSLRMVNDRKWEALFGFPRRKGEAELEQVHCDLAMAIQLVTEEAVILMAKEAKRLTGAKYLCLSGGVALNCVANGKLEREGVFEQVFIQPAAGDAGGALGAALAAEHIFFGGERVMAGDMHGAGHRDGSEAGHRDGSEAGPKDAMQGSYLGPDFTSSEVEQLIRRYGAVAQRYDDFEELAGEVAAVIEGGAAVGWMQGRMEFGPRALGNRSILGDPRNPEMQKKLNLKIKYRESFRPFAPSVLAEYAAENFNMVGDSPYMLLVHPVAAPLRNQPPVGYHDLPLREKLYFERSSLPAITHIDYSARIQTVHRETNPRYWGLIDAFRQRTGCPVLVNTSFNVRGEPIVCTPEDAYRCFMRTEMDCLVMGDFVFEKKAQPDWKEEKKWQEEFVLD